MVLIDIALHFRYGKPAKTNPWNADTLEWANKLPPTPYNFVSLPPIETRHPLWEHPELPQEMEEGKHGLASADHGRRADVGHRSANRQSA